jgi:hypothetical protein
MASLILVDVDNLLPYQQPLPVGQAAVTACFATLGAVPPLGRLDPSCVVVCALNTVSVRTRRLNLGDLQMLARGLATRCIQNAQVKSIEVLLVLNMPETADGALLRALHWAAEPSGAIEVREILLLSSDRDLRNALPGASSPLWSGSRSAWRIPLKSPISRKLPAPRSPAGTLPVASGWLALSEPALAEAAATKPPQVSGKTLLNLANQVEQHPAFLTQIGPTLRSHRGASRLALHLSGKPTTLACHEDDHLEYLASQLSPPRTGEGTIETCSVGHGAVAVLTSGGRYVFRTSLPWHFLKATYPLSGHRIQKNHLPDEHLLGVGHETMTGIHKALPFSFVPSSGKIRCIMGNPERGEYPPSWWVFHRNENLSTTVKYQELSTTNITLRRPVDDVKGTMVTAEIEGMVELVARSSLRTGELVELGMDAARGELVPATNLDVEGGGPCAFLTLGRPWKRGARIKAVAIQHAEPHLLQAHGLSNQDILHLRRLPIVIALQILADLPGGQPAARRQGAP